MKSHFWKPIENDAVTVIRFTVMIQITIQSMMHRIDFAHPRDHGAEQMTVVISTALRSVADRFDNGKAVG